MDSVKWVVQLFEYAQLSTIKMRQILLSIYYGRGWRMCNSKIKMKFILFNNASDKLCKSLFWTSLT